jgi:triosephosphate isomerase
MSKLLIVANLKSYKDLDEAKIWLGEFLKYKDAFQNLQDKEIIICPSFPYLFSFNSALSENIKIGAQDISPFDEGAYTGEVNAKQIKDFAQFVLIGHSERRVNFGETDDMFLKKVQLSLKYNLEPIFLLQNKDETIPGGVKIVAYEPIFAIGSGTPDTPENADNIALSIKGKGNYQVLYGGSVTSGNVKSFTDKNNLNGVVVGGASLDPEEFIKIIQNA